MQSTSEVERQKQHYDRKAIAISLQLGDLVLAKANTYRGENGEGSVGGGTIQSGASSCRRHPFLHHEKPADRMLTSPPLNMTFSHYSDRGDSSLYGCAGQVGQVHHHHYVGTNSEE